MPPILVPFSGKWIAKELVISKLIDRKDFILRGFVSDFMGPSKKLFVKIYQLKQKNTVWKLIKIENEETRAMASFYFFYCYLWTYFNPCSNCWIWTGKRLLGSYGKDKYFKWQDRVEKRCKYNENLPTNSVWT